MTRPSQIWQSILGPDANGLWNINNWRNYTRPPGIENKELNEF